MAQKSINEVVATNLKHYMEQKGHTQQSLGTKSGLGQTTIGLYLNPKNRQPSKSGRIPGGTLTQLESIATALEIDPWKLLRPLDDAERTAYETVETAFQALLGNLKQTAKAAPVRDEEPSPKVAARAGAGNRAR